MSFNIERLIAEVAARHQLLLKPDDAAFALVTMNSLVLEEALQSIHSRVVEDLAKIEASARGVDAQAGKLLAEQVRESAVAWKRAIGEDIQLASARSAELIDRVSLAHSRPAMLRWGALGLFAGMIFFACGILFAVYVR